MEAAQPRISCFGNFTRSSNKEKRGNSLQRNLIKKRKFQFYDLSMIKLNPCNFPIHVFQDFKILLTRNWISNIIPPLIKERSTLNRFLDSRRLRRKAHRSHFPSRTFSSVQLRAGEPKGGSGKESVEAQVRAESFWRFHRAMVF